MRYSLAAGAILAASVSSVVGQDCAGSQLLGGNWYCDLIESIIYGGFPTSGTYNGVKSFSQDGQCEFGAVNFDGPLGVFGEEVCCHILNLTHIELLTNMGDPAFSSQFTFVVPPISRSSPYTRLVEAATASAANRTRTLTPMAMPTPTLTLAPGATPNLSLSW